MLIDPADIVNKAVAVFQVPSGQTFYNGLANLSVTFQVAIGTPTGNNPWNQTATTTPVVVTAYVSQDKSERFQDDAGTDLSQIRLIGHCVSPTSLPNTIGFGDEGAAIYTTAGGREYSGRFKIIASEQEQYASIQAAFGQPILGLLTVTGQD